MKTLLTLLILTASAAHAQTVTVDVIHRSNSLKGLSRQDAKRAFAATAEQIRAETGVRLRVKSWRSYPVGLIRMPRNPGPFGPHLPAILGSNPVNESANPAAITLVISPRYEWRGSWWSAGYSTVCGERALAIVGRLHRYGDKSLLPAQTVITHEMGHALGAKHKDEACQVMHPDAGGGQLVPCGWVLPFAPESVQEIRECVGAQ
jgi:hypothetical protein